MRRILAPLSVMTVVATSGVQDLSGNALADYLAARLAGGRTVAAVVAGGQLLGIITADDLARAATQGERPRAVA